MHPDWDEEYGCWFRHVFLLLIFSALIFRQDALNTLQKNSESCYCGVGNKVPEANCCGDAKIRQRNINDLFQAGNSGATIGVPGCPGTRPMTSGQDQILKLPHRFQVPLTHSTTVHCTCNKIQHGCVPKGHSNDYHTRILVHKKHIV